ncbi:M56 family metallopeptidase [Tautonia marina]|uniref:M56 family metallopeptidase n=1 Tax=Tautonia marina TaxID=2653855 RepID=UPI001261343D|nr:M56 family metallopeptidase [Tautonia marina]
MTILIDVIDRALPILWRATWQASLLVVLVLVVRAILGERLSPAWRHALWCLVLARLLVPVLPSSPASLYRLAPTLGADANDKPARVASMPSQNLPMITDPAPTPTDPARSVERPSLVAELRDERGIDRATAPLTRPPARWSLPRLAGLAWLLGVFLLSSRTLVASVRLARTSRTWADADDPEILALLNACRHQMGLRRSVRVRIAPDDLGPAATGFVRPSIVIPRSVLASISRNDLEHILMHECAHIRRGDVAVHWLTTAAVIVHWFNPVSWFVASRIRADRELACDAEVLSRLDGDRRSSYGGTILSLAGRLVPPRPLPGLVGAFGARSLLQERITMIASSSPHPRAWNRLAALLLILLALVGLTDAAPPPIEAEEPALRAVPQPIAPRIVKDDPLLDDATQKRIDELIRDLREINSVFPPSWASSIRDLAELGEIAVPSLIEELDRTTEDRPLRALGFTLRAIGDPRAVPALIRAIPRTLVESGSDSGLRMEDPELRAFLQEHDLDGVPRDRSFNFGRSFREITGALKAITGQQFNEGELNFVALAGGPAQQRLQRRYMHDLAERWATWWEDHWRQFTDDPAHAEVNLPPLPAAPQPAKRTDPSFPTGPKARQTGIWANVIAGPPQSLDYYRTFIDLDTRRELPWPDALGTPDEAAPENVAFWAADAGYDLQGIAYQPPGSQTSAYGIRGIGLRAWQVEDEVFGTIEQDLRGNRIPDLDRPAGEILVDIDPATGSYRPEHTATFLFQTREGATGILQVTGQITELFTDDDIGQPGLSTTRGFYRGVQFQYKLLYEEEE